MWLYIKKRREAQAGYIDQGTYICNCSNTGKEVAAAENGRSEYKVGTVFCAD